MATVPDAATWTGPAGETWTNHGAMTVTLNAGYYNPAVIVAVEVAFAANPLVNAPTWTDITTDVRSFSITRGRKSELDDYKAAVLTVLVDANAGDYDPTDTAGTHYPNVVPMKQIRVHATYGGITYDLFRGNVTGWPMTVKGQTDETVSIKAVDGFKILALQKDSTAQSEELSSVRVGNLLDEAGWSAGLRDLGTGVATIPAGTPDCATVLQLIRQVTGSEAGQFYIGPDGSAVFRNRTYRSGLTSVATFGPASGQVPYQDIKTDYDDSQIWNRIEVFIGGFPSYSSSTASQDSYGIRTLTFNEILLPNTTDGNDLADVYRDRYKDPLERIESITLKPDASPVLMWPQVLGRELSDKVTVEYQTNGGNTKSLASFIEGISHRVTIGKAWQTTFALTQFE